ncbi:hypothetical protein BH23GEM9_BH23GEM9_21720 [soil metagenome]
MADIRVERKSGISPWVWVALAVVALIVAVVLLDYYGYIDLPVRMGATHAEPAFMAQSGSVAAPLQEV